MAPGGTLFRFTPHFGENVLPHGSHECLPYSKDEVRLKSVNNNLSSHRNPLFRAWRKPEPRFGLSDIVW